MQNKIKIKTEQNQKCLIRASKNKKQAEDQQCQLKQTQL